MVFGGLMQKIQQVQEQMRQALAELGEAEFEGEAGGGAVKITLTGHKQLKAVHISPEAADPEDLETLEDLLLAAFNNASVLVDAARQERFGEATEGLPIPKEFLGI